MSLRPFSAWKNWSERTSHSRLHLPGIYALSITANKIQNTPFSWTPEIVYFGMTNSISGLSGRLSQFERTISGKSGHGGAQRFLFDFNDHTRLAPNLYVAVMPFECDVKSNQPADLIVMGEIARAEYECFAKFADLFNRPPKYNDKKLSPKAVKSVKN